MKRKLSLLLVFALLVTMLTGCGMKANYEVTNDGKLYGTAKIYMTDEEKAAYDEVAEGESAEGYVGKEVVNGVEYHVYATEKELVEKTAGMIVTPEKFYVDSASEVMDDGSEEVDLLEFSFMTLSVTMPKEIVKTNGTLSADKKTATWELLSTKDSAIYAYTTANPKTNSISLKTGSAKYVKANKAISISTKDKAEFVTLSNGAVIDGNKNSKVFVNGIKFDGKKKTLTFRKSGTYKFTVWTTTNFKSFTVKVDGDKPTVKGVANNKTYKKSVKITFKDKLSGVKSATLNGKKIKSGKKITKAGKYTLVVTDKVGNKTTIKFKIKK